MTTLQDVAAFIGGATRPEVDTIFDLCKQRTKMLYAVAATENFATLSVGDVVVLDGVSPKYLNGMTATIKSMAGRRRGRVAVQLVDGAVGRFSGTTMDVPASCLTKATA